MTTLNEEIEPIPTFRDLGGFFFLTGDKCIAGPLFGFASPSWRSLKSTIGTQFLKDVNNYPKWLYLAEHLLSLLSIPKRHHGTTNNFSDGTIEIACIVTENNRRTDIQSEQFAWLSWRPAVHPFRDSHLFIPGYHPDRHHHHDYHNPDYHHHYSHYSHNHHDYHFDDDDSTWRRGRLLALWILPASRVQTMSTRLSHPNTLSTSFYNILHTISKHFPSQEL